MAQRVRRRQDDHRAARPPDSPLRHRGNRQRQLALQKPRRRSHNPRSPRLRNPGQLRRGERYRQTAPLKGVKIGRRYGVKFERRLTYWVPPYACRTSMSRGWVQKCVPSAVPELRTSTLKLTVFILTRLRSRPLVFGMSFSCLPSLLERLHLQPALSPPLSPKNLNYLSPVDRRRWNTIARHHSRGVWRSRKSIPRSPKMQPRHRLRRMDLPASTQKGHRPRAAKGSIRTN